MRQILYFLCFCALLVCAQAGEFPYTYKGEKGYSVVIPKKPSRIIIAGGMWPLPPLIAMLQGHAKNIVYMPRATKNAIKYSFISEIYPELKHIKDGENENIEELLALKPDLFMCYGANVKVCEAMRAANVPTIEISVNKWHYNSYETLKGWIDILAPILDARERGEKLLAYTKQVEKEVSAKASKEKNKPRAMVIHAFDSEKSFSLGGIFADYLLEKTGAINVISGESMPRITLEEAYRLNPDIIYINNFNTLVPEDLIESKLWQPINAVKNKRVYKFPLGAYRPFAPSVDLPIFMEWIYYHNYPQYEDKEKFLAHTQAFYEEYFGVKLSKKQVERIFTPQKAAGLLK
ncbi:hypothetical protein LS71_002960 [Helicobacter jaachi]|uniref:Fe/B12 periplasmic-binding domain-containing protein n=1 Tax=Helicobacter jaachi TaxID=1677920 RepID=A0A4U8TCK4_9HELI|nr:ABC transporter substrate-binding protein [Helicobacter jaachi]TLD97710.1 hypothetical protein LS71_002960 [Helicobacter jaachi]